ncbi:MAG TPA: anhydro-N-acetylmuramic acid kinase [Alphaproteobacteria bacterium]|nr:anhydro-N-acetylmuramic acid kinase [Alphaproteobacteria bacterium]
MPQQSHVIKRPKNGVFRILGLMSGTSMDGIDVALLETDGKTFVKRGRFASYAYSAAFRKKLRASLGKKRAPQVERELTQLHARAVKTFLKTFKIKNVDALGFHGHTILHAPGKRITVQIGDGKLLAKLTGLPVLWDFRTEDVKAGGQGAPLVPVYHQALAATWKQPCAFVNIGGVANITYIDGKNLIAFDTGPGNALMDDYMMRWEKKPFDRNGTIASLGRARQKDVEAFLRHPFFKKKPPKSLDRDAFTRFMPQHGVVPDAVMTLTAMTAQSIAAGLKHVPKKPRLLAVTGGGRKNKTLMQALARAAGIPVIKVEDKKLNGDALEAEAFAYLAARVILKLPISFKTTTGRKKP